MAPPVTRVRIQWQDVKLVTEEDKVCGIIADKGSFEPETIAAWVDACSDGRASTAIDVGSYSGLFAISAALMFNHSIAIEAKPENAERVRRNVEYNRVDVTVIEGAASNYDGEGKLNTNGARNSVASSLTYNSKTHNRTVPVTVVRLDSLPFKRRVGAIKIDVEDHEYEVLEGALETIARDRPVLLVETLDDTHRERATKLLSSHGYRCAGFLDGRNLHMLPD